MKKIEELLKKLSDNEKLIKELSNVESMEELIIKVKESGLELSNEDFDELTKALDNDELSDDELDDVAGGADVRVKPTSRRDM